MARKRRHIPTLIGGVPTYSSVGTMGLKARNRDLASVVGDAVQITVWRRLRRVVMRYAAVGPSAYARVDLETINRLEMALAGSGWTMHIDNSCRTEWRRT